MLVVTTSVLVLVCLNNAMNRQINAQYQEQHGAYMPEPFLERTHLLRQISDADGAVTNQPGDQHDRQTGT